MDNLTIVVYENRGDCFFHAWNPNTQKFTAARIDGGQSNLRGAEFTLRGRYPLNGENRWYFAIYSLSAREFNNPKYKNLPSAGCRSEDILAFIQKEIG
jgi:hypothetical protein